MKKIKLIFPLLQLLFTKPSVLLKALYHAVINQNRRDHVINKYGLKDGLPEVNFLDVFSSFNGEVNTHSLLYGTSMPIDMAVLVEFAKRFNECDYLEIGTWRGESLVNVAPHCNSCVSVSLSDDEMKQFGFNEKYVLVQRFFSKDLKNVKHIGANSRTFDFHSLNQKFDLIFVDGDHSYDGVLSDTKKVFELLKNENSIIVWHDCVAQYEIPDFEVVGGILDGAPADKRNKIFHLTNTLCAVYMNKSFKTKTPDFPAVPDKKFEMTIRAEKI
ncbi:MAG: class I SAM-dependent methyltransferase [Bacteroidota bacterium]